MSAKLRMTIWQTLLVLLLCIAVLVFVLVLNSHDLSEDAESMLVRTVLSNADELDFDHGQIDADELALNYRGVYCSFYDEEGHMILAALPAGVDVSDYPFTPNEVREITIGGESYYMYDYYKYVDYGGVWTRGIVATTNEGSLMHGILLATAIVLPIVLILSFLGSYLIAWLSFRPLSKINSAAESISAGDDLSARIGLRRGAKEFKRLSNTFDNMFERLEKDFNAQKQFASDASHELRTPITVILAECDHAKRKGKSQEELTEAIEVIEEQTTQMSNLVQELLSLTRMQQGTDRYPLREGDLSEFIIAISEEYVPSDARGISLHTDVQPEVMVSFNASLLSRLVMNLLQNAYKYGETDGNIWLSLSSEEGHAVIRVKDDGIGIPEAEQEKIFQRFYQVDSSRGEEGSTGLGLAMVKEIAEYHGGSVEVESTVGVGSTFIVRI